MKCTFVFTLHCFNYILYLINMYYRSDYIFDMSVMYLHDNFWNEIQWMIIMYVSLPLWFKALGWGGRVGRFTNFIKYSVHNIFTNCRSFICIHNSIRSLAGCWRLLFCSDIYSYYSFSLQKFYIQKQTMNFNIFVQFYMPIFPSLSVILNTFNNFYFKHSQLLCIL